MAHGGAAPNFKFYFYAKQRSLQALFLAEVILNTGKPLLAFDCCFTSNPWDDES